MDNFIPIYNAQTLKLFSGVDVTKGLFNGKGLRPNLFQLAGSSRRVTVDNDDGSSSTFDVPSFLRLTWERLDSTTTVKGETKAEYQANLSTVFGLENGVVGFGNEVNESFDESTFPETYKRYASVYNVQQHYILSLLDKTYNLAKLRLNLDPKALDFLATKSAAEIVDTYGTHFMTRAVFGKLERSSCSLDVRDNLDRDLSSIPEFDDAVKLKVSNQPFTSGSSRVQQIFNQLENGISATFGDRNDPGIAGYQLKPIADLIEDPKKRADVAEEVRSRLSLSKVTPTRALLMYAPMEHASDDRNSHANDDLATCNVRGVSGWSQLGQYGMGPSYDGDFRDNPSHWRGLLIRDIPGAKTSMIKAPTDVQRKWGMRARKRCGLYEMIGPNGFSAISAFFHEDDASGLDSVKGHVLVSDELTLPGQFGDRLWEDKGTGANDDGTAWKVLNDPKIAVLPTAGDRNPCYFFHAESGYDKPRYNPRVLDFSKFTIVSNKWLDPMQTFLNSGILK